MITHRKTRTGCVQCKHRRIKCDENKPVCEKCRRTNRECSFLSATTATFRSVPPVQVAPSADTFTMKEMELLHHFVMCTSLSLVNHSAQQKVWQTAVVELALRHRFLMHTVLSLSALHLARKQPQEGHGLSVLAANHQDKGLIGFRNELQRLDQYNCDALYATSILIIYYVPATATTRINPKPNTTVTSENLFKATVDWIRLVRGSGQIVARGRTWLEEGPLWPLVPREAWFRSIEPRDQRSHDEDHYLSSIERLWAPDTPATFSTYSNDEIVLYVDALAKLRQAFARMSIAESAVGDCCWCTPEANDPSYLDARVPRIIAGVLWQMLISDSFFTLIEQKKPLALVILAHYTIVVRRSSNEWWNNTPAIKIMTAVTENLPVEYHAWIEWPQQEINFDPKIHLRSAVDTKD